jgi:hypothetical protein
MPPFPGNRFPGGLPRSNSQPPDGQNSLLVGKNAGNFAESASFLRNPSQKQLQFQWLARKFPTDGAGNYFAPAGNFSGFLTGAGNFAQNRSARSNASDRPQEHNQQSRYVAIADETFCFFGPAARGYAATQTIPGAHPQALTWRAAVMLSIDIHAAP